MGKASRKKKQTKSQVSLSTQHATANFSDVQSSTLLKFFANTRWVHLLIIIITGIVIYSNTLDFNFILDDHTIVRSPAVHDLKNVFKHKDNPAMNERFFLYLSRPVAMMSFVLNYKIHGFDVAGYHVFNLLIHIVTALLVYTFAALTLKTEVFIGTGLSAKRHLIAFFTSLLFVAHPIQTQAVTYISQRFASLATLFYMLSLVLYILFRLSFNQRETSSVSAKGIAYYAATIVTAIIAYKTKETAYTIPFACLLCEVTFFRSNRKRHLLLLIPVFLSLLVFPLTILLVKTYSIIDAGSQYAQMRAIGMNQDMPRLHYLFTEFVVLVRYLGLLLLPVNQTIYHDYTIYKSFFDLPVLLSFAFFAVPVAFTAARLIRNPEETHYRIIVFGILWYLLTMSIESSVIPLYPIYEHRLYLPTAGIFFSVVTTIMLFLYRFKSKSRIVQSAVAAIIIAIISVYAVAAYKRNEVYSSDRAFWEDVKSKKTSHIPHSLVMNLGLAYMREGRYEDALNEFKRIVNDAPNNESAHNAIGVICLKMKRYDDAIAAYKKALSINPDIAEARIGIGQAYLYTGRISEAIENLQSGKKTMYPHYMIYNLLGYAYIKNNQPDDAIKELFEAQRLKPKDPTVFFNLGLAYNMKKQASDAINAYEEAVRIKPDFVDAYIQLGMVYANQKMFDKASQAFSKALLYSPGHPDAERRLAEIAKKR